MNISLVHEEYCKLLNILVRNGMIFTATEYGLKFFEPKTSKVIYVNSQ